MSVTQTIWRNMLKMPDFVIKDNNKIGSINHGAESLSLFEDLKTENHCWLCGGDAGSNYYPTKNALGGSFTDHNIAKFTESNVICDCCVAFMSKESWVMACERYGHDPYFPVKEGKKPFLSNWMFSSHVFSMDGWERPSKKQARNILLSPPEPPFVITLADSGKKHVIFRAAINYDADNFYVQLDENAVNVNKDLFQEMLVDFENAYSMGLNKNSLLTGIYNHAACAKIGVPAWREVEEIMSYYRMMHYKLLNLVAFVAVKNEADTADSDDQTLELINLQGK